MCCKLVLCQLPLCMPGQFPITTTKKNHVFYSMFTLLHFSLMCKILTFPGLFTEAMDGTLDVGLISSKCLERGGKT